MLKWQNATSCRINMPDAKAICRDSLYSDLVKGSKIQKNTQMLKEVSCLQGIQILVQLNEVQGRLRPQVCVCGCLWTG